MTDDTMTQDTSRDVQDTGAQARLESVPLAGEGADDDEATTTAGPGLGGSTGRTGEGPTAETDDVPETPTGG